MTEMVFMQRTESGYTNIKAFETAVLSFAINKSLVVTISDKAKRTDRQNKYFHACCKIFGDAFGYTKDEAKGIIKMKFLKVEKVDENTGEIFVYLQETHKLNKEEFSEFMNHFIIWAAQLGVVIPMPDEQLNIF